ncbi:hypothetical protein RFI_22837 [Reticulomyxa filosa]|uniref:Protein kinase domain-containing protein n=1 Tax=Reticulomyxa filosa TaxID=46433 RepID=X6ML08_RETFI|nr:hypothetical protein RFI_22837 [Reticulomyxa filosa]|eukprot:ETO14534.1 hypothetical protein RFI_22837 [Reticulomyxa filosa]
MSSTPPELALLMGTDTFAMNIELTGKTLRKVDSWRVGVLLYALITGTLPYAASTLQNFITHILAGQPVIPLQSIKCSYDLKNLLSQLLEPTFFKRIDIQDALKHSWFKVGELSYVFFICLFYLRINCYLMKTKMESFHMYDTYTDSINGIGFCVFTCTFVERGIRHLYTLKLKLHLNSKGYDLPNREQRDRKYFFRLDATGQREKLRVNILDQDNLAIFIEDRLGYCPFKARSIIKVKINVYIYVYILDLIKSTKKSQWTWQDFESYYNELDMTKNQTMLLTNAIFRGLDPQGTGIVKSTLLLSLFEDINLRMKPVIDKIKSQSEMSFVEVHEGLKKAINDGFDISELLSVDHIVKVPEKKLKIMS